MSGPGHHGRGVDAGPRVALAWLVAVAVLWTAVETVAAPLLARLSPYQVVWMRYAVHLAVVWIIWGRGSLRSLARTRRPMLQVGRSALMIAMPASWATAVALGTDPHDIMAVFWMAPLLMVAFAFALGHEPFRLWRWVAAGAAVAGAWLASGAFRLPQAAEWPLPLAMAASFALYVVLTRSLRNEPIEVNLFWTGAGVIVPLTLVMPFVWIAPSAGDLARVVVVGGLGVAGLYALDRMAAAAPVGLTAPAHGLPPALFAVMTSIAVAPPGWREAAGVLSIAALVAALWFVASPDRAPHGNRTSASTAASRPPGAIE